MTDVTGNYPHIYNPITLRICCFENTDYYFPMDMFYTLLEKQFKIIYSCINGKNNKNILRNICCFVHVKKCPVFKRRPRSAELPIYANNIILCKYSLLACILVTFCRTIYKFKFSMFGLLWRGITLKSNAAV